MRDVPSTRTRQSVRETLEGSRNRPVNRSKNSGAFLQTQVYAVAKCKELSSVYNPLSSGFNGRLTPKYIGLQMTLRGFDRLQSFPVNCS